MKSWKTHLPVICYATFFALSISTTMINMMLSILIYYAGFSHNSQSFLFPFAFANGLSSMNAMSDASICFESVSQNTKYEFKATASLVNSRTGFSSALNLNVILDHLNSWHHRTLIRIRSLYSCQIFWSHTKYYAESFL